MGVVAVARRRIGVVVSPLGLARWDWFERIGVAGVGWLEQVVLGSAQAFAW